ncbi:hypothetical protein BN2475_440011 [Paraburkholderia ribeironis]|uniref:Uncharacterized protein n=1 Tax=Paraburkholderia ribeironis TaxID=1247936 RepID=A0A1N7S857_9BURK|nr:hypothetical protein BN2475_440011 [Paraburkholderia ribeironis]
MWCDVPNRRRHLSNELRRNDWACVRGSSGGTYHERYMPGVSWGMTHWWQALLCEATNSVYGRTPGSR